jgi:hypothetical protein
MAMNYAYHMKKDTTVECVLYGRFDHDKGTSHIHDASALFFMNEIVGKLVEMKSPDPEGVIRIMLGLDEEGVKNG